MMKVENIKTLFTLTFMYKEGKEVLLTLCNISIDKGTLTQHIGWSSKNQ